jgi:hypothetical protein
LRSGLGRFRGGRTRVGGSGRGGFGGSALTWTAARLFPGQAAVSRTTASTYPRTFPVRLGTSPDSLGRLQAFLLAEEFEAFTLKLHSRLLQFAAAQVHNGRSELFDGIEPGRVFVFRHDPQVLQKVRVMGEEHDVQVIRGYAGIDYLRLLPPCSQCSAAARIALRGAFAGVLGDDAGFVEERGEGEPFFVTASAPFREVEAPASMQ